MRRFVVVVPNIFSGCTGRPFQGVVQSLSCGPDAPGGFVVGDVVLEDLGLGGVQVFGDGACSMVCVSPSVGRTDTDDCY